jgi:hypothetical protein
VADLVRSMLVALVVLLVSWGLLMVLAKRLPPGILKDLAGFLPACLTMLRRLRADPRVPRRAKLIVLVAGLWVLSPIDLIPEFLPVIGPLDDVVVGLLATAEAVFVGWSCPGSWRCWAGFSPTRAGSAWPAWSPSPPLLR